MSQQQDNKKKVVFIISKPPPPTTTTTTIISTGGGVGGVSLRPLSKLVAVAFFAAILLIWSLGCSVARKAASPPSSLHRPSFFLGSFPSAASAAKSNETTHIAAPTWISHTKVNDYTSTLISRWLAPGGEPCADSRAVDISSPFFDRRENKIELAAGEVHEFEFFTVDESGRKRCRGGDYFETDLFGEKWKSRPPVTDNGDGSYSVKLQVHQLFSGEYNFTIVLLFRSFEGLKFSPARFKFSKEIRRIPIVFRRTSSKLPDLELCRREDFSRQAWSGRWTRHGGKENCSVDEDGRYRCLDSNFPCQSPWCEGALEKLESNGWVYSAHCSFKIFNAKSAWECLHGRWIFFWGDSNHVDTVRNLLTFVLGVNDSSSVTRRFDKVFANPYNSSETVRISNIFNGHWNETKNYLGLESLKNEQFRELLWKYFLEEKPPDCIILNSGLHDGVHYRSIRAFVEGADYAARFWEEVIRHYYTRNSMVPRVFYRTTIATGGYARELAFNPAKMEAFNCVFVEKLRQMGVITGGVIDDFDMTFPWHYDNRCNDGVHYGRAPAKARWRDGEIGHQYFVDLMLGNVILNAICNR